MSRSILDAFTIFPFAIILALALGEAFKLAVVEDDFIIWNKLYALMSFLFLILPFYQGMNRYFLVTYSEAAQPPRPSAHFLIIDGGAFLIESALFFVMSRALAVLHWQRFYWVVFSLLVVDSLWGLTVRMHSNPLSAAVIKEWTTLNLITAIGILLLVLLLGRFVKNPHWLALIGAAGMLMRTIVDYRISWDFYFPAPT